ncbi:MAG: hypothetical protein GXO77_03500 [Calditrichaeota bacterium]|nr:hypothetical protein [Calditrichota bacterium]
MEKSLKNIFINSTLAFVSAFLLTTFIHEFGHFISYYLSGAHPVLFHNRVYASDQQMSIQIKIISALAGPIFSLAQGIVFVIPEFRKQGNKISDLLFLWLGLLGFINFFGYLMLTPISEAGDTGKVAELLQIPYSFRILIAVAGIVILLVIIRQTGRLFTNFIPEKSEFGERRKYVNRIMFFPVLTGSIVNAILSFPIMVTLSVIYPATSSFVIMSAYKVILKTQKTGIHKSVIEDRISLFLIILTAIVIIVNRLLTIGIG